MDKISKLIAVLSLLFNSFVYADEFQFVDSTFCPFVCDPNAEGKEGFVIEILRDALATEDHTINFTIVPYKRALSLVRNGEAHALPAIYSEDAPDLTVGKSVIGIGNNHFFVRHDSEWKYTSIDSWQHITIGVVDGYTFSHPQFDRYLAKQKNALNSKVVFISGGNNYRRLLTLLISGRVDAILDDSAYIQYELQRLHAENSLSSMPPIISVGALSKGQHVVAYSPKHPEIAKMLMSIIDPFVIELYETGKIDVYLSRYGID
ncbi:transporter substrate-binding domain-containing protein [Aliiglaciecola litoralis]|uniref:ABC transporter substrate-binding protein n=1 Tax=Aliiglaciecola litoralis TaxID=582857 RepID=A0ABP3WQB8_9ALTE